MENAGCCAALDGQGTDPPRVQGPWPVPALPLEAATCCPVASRRYFFKIRRKKKNIYIYITFNLFLFLILVIWRNSYIV